MHILARHDVERFRGLVRRRFGLAFEDARLDELADVLRGRLVATGKTDVDAYAAQVASSPGERRLLAARLTVNETYLFRNNDSFRALAEAVIPACVVRRGKERKLRILSAGCASGEECYTIAIVAHEALEGDGLDVDILGVDVNASMIERAERGRYGPWSFRATPDDVRRQWFDVDGNDAIVGRTARQGVRFFEHNLVDDDPLVWAPESYDVVFCRNVLMYMGTEVSTAIVARIHRALVPGGYLFLGHAETLRGLSQSFHLRHTHETFYYEARADERADEHAVTVAPISAPAPHEIAMETSWVDTIRHASERITLLARPREPSPADSPPARWDTGLVLEAIRQERFNEGLELLAGLAPDVHDEEALLLRAVLLANVGRLTESEETCRRLLSLDELSAGAHYVMALCREHAADADGAIHHDETAAYLDPGFAMPRLHRGLLARRAGDVSTARTELAHALELLAREESGRVLLYGGGFSRDALAAVCRAELRAAGGDG